MSALALQAGLRVLVTGGAAGIGRVIAETFLSAGARVLVCDSDGDALAQELARQGGLSGHRCDSAVEPSARRGCSRRSL